MTVRSRLVVGTPPHVVHWPVGSRTRCTITHGGALRNRRSVTVTWTPVDAPTGNCHMRAAVRWLNTPPSDHSTAAQHRCVTDDGTGRGE
jgi:hypothetical protein